MNITKIIKGYNKLKLKFLLEKWFKFIAQCNLSLELLHNI